MDNLAFRTDDDGHVERVAVRSGAPLPVSHAGGCRMFQVRGTCCLHYRSAVESGPPAERYCSTCPLRDDTSRRRRLEQYLNS